jgi:multicomponent Na+:H+ antiporter subunit C
METLLAVLIGGMVGAGVYLLLRRSLLRVLFGVIILSNAVNLTIFTAGRVQQPASPPLVPEGLQAPAVAVGNPLPQALVLTAIVIGFGLVAFALVLVLRGYDRLGTLVPDEVEFARRDPEEPAVSAPPTDRQEEEALGAGLPPQARL